VKHLLDEIVAFLFRIPAAWVVAAVYAIPALETAIVLGFLLPGELAVVAGGAIASRGKVPLAAVLAAAVAGPFTGDALGYLLGRSYGEAWMRRRLGKRWGRAHRWLSKKGGAAIFVGRFLPFVRAVLPATAGAIEVPARRFFGWDFAAALVWGIGSALLGYAAGLELERGLRWMHRSSVALLALAAAGGAAWFVWKRSSRRKASHPPVRRRAKKTSRRS